HFVVQHITVIESAAGTPVVVFDEIEVPRGGTATVLVGGANSVLANDSDPNPGVALTAQLQGFGGTERGSGTIAMSANGTFASINGGGPLQTDTFKYQACDPDNACMLGVVTIHVTSAQPNDLPVTKDDTIGISPGGTATSLFEGADSVLANDSDRNGDAL